MQRSNFYWNVDVDKGWLNTIQTLFEFRLIIWFCLFFFNISSKNEIKEPLYEYQEKDTYVYFDDKYCANVQVCTHCGGFVTTSRGCSCRICCTEEWLAPTAGSMRRCRRWNISCTTDYQMYTRTLNGESMISLGWSTVLQVSSVLSIVLIID